MVPISALVLGDSPRLAGEDPGHIQTLAEAGTELPPILVHRETMRVVDGQHRVQVARLNGQQHIAVVFFTGEAREAFVRAVEANTSHGLPLTLEDRREAARRIIALFPEWSDRAVAEVTRLGPRTVATIRSSTDSIAQSNMRIGRDGRTRPLEPAQGRLRAAEVIARRPEASLRDIASAAGVSVSTARDVRLRISSGENPLPASMRPADDDSATDRAGQSTRRRGNRPRATAFAHPRPTSIVMDVLRKDPSLRYTDAGRFILRWLDSHVVDTPDWNRIVTHIPPHCGYTIAELAVGCAQAWQQLAEELQAIIDDTEPASHDVAS
ncbi:ParB/RepB/Spo0J family partition protein [Micromonospora sp. DT48]|uniref:ParB/RepB/Spo0J family partition protein n=1 Tax=unclassified Micromonospora TaxID=2617518 RepID=UPI0012BBEE47|nr:ParB/RepB/Spo0J family partition protein [Micromonospora sp. CP22]MTK01469.1 streptomycin biosynthesis protein [Micromonospora sp. CP22]